MMKLWKILRTDVALQNSLFLISSTGVMALSGFVFWFISARLYSPEQIGLSSTLIAAATTLALFSMLGFDNVLVRYLPGSKQPNRVIDTSIIVTLMASLALSVLFLASLSFISPTLHAVLASPWHRLIFLLGMALVTVNTLTDSIFISFRSSKYILFADSGLSLGKIALPLILVTWGAFGLFLAYILSITIATIISVAYLYSRFSYRFLPVVERATLVQVRKFSAGTYGSNLVGAVPMMAVPIILTNALGAQHAAYFNLAMTIAAMLFIVPRSTANSLFAEGSKDLRTFGHQTWRTVGQTAAIIVPVGIAFYFGGHLLLSIFGSAYATGATVVLQILVLSAFGLGLNAISQTILKVHHKLLPLFLIQTIGTATTVALAWPLASAYGASGGAWAWLIGQYAMSALHLAVVIPLVSQHTSKVAVTRATVSKLAGGQS